MNLDFGWNPMNQDRESQRMREPQGVLDPKYRDHPVFAQLSRYAEFYDSLSTSVFNFSTLGTKAICNIDSYVYSSIQGTLESISNALSSGRIGDSYALLRRYHDSAIINVYTNLYLQDNFSIANFIVDQIQDWFNGQQRLPEFRVMSRYIRTSSSLAPVINLLFGHSTYSDIRNRCNDFTHYNFYCNMLSNDGRIFLENRIELLEQFSEDLDNLLILHLGLIFYLNGHYMMSSDYVDYLDCDLSPPVDSQYLVAPFVQDIFDSVIKKRRPDIYLAIKGKTSMKLE